MSEPGGPRLEQVVNSDGLLRSVDAVTVPVPDLDRGLAFHSGVLGHELQWRHDAVGQAGLRLPGSTTELVLTLEQPYAPAWLVESAVEAARTIEAAGGRVVHGPRDVPVGTLVVALDPFGNRLVLVDLTKGRYATDDDGTVIGVRP